MGRLDYISQEDYDEWREQEAERKRKRALEEVEARQPEPQPTPWQQAFTQPEPPRPFGPLPAGYYPQPAPGSQPLPQQAYGPQPVDDFVPPPPPEPTPWQRAWQDDRAHNIPPVTMQPSEGSVQPSFLQDIGQRLGRVGPALGRDIRNPLPVAERALEGVQNITDIAGVAGPLAVGDELGRLLGIRTERSGLERGSPELAEAQRAKAIEEGMLAFLPEGPARGIAGAAGEAANRAITRGYILPGYGLNRMAGDITRDVQEVIGPRENQYGLTRGPSELEEAWKRWETEKRNPFLDMANPANWVNPPKMVLRAPGVRLTDALADKAGVVKEGIGAAREGVEAVGRAIPEVGQAWEMTKAELNKTGYIAHDTATGKDFVRPSATINEAANASEHARIVAAAVAHGEKVPPEVLADYPDLAVKAKVSLTEALSAPIVDEVYESMRQAAIDWQYLTVKGGGMARKSELDAWLMQRYGIDAAEARSISNGIEAERPFMIGGGKIEWLGRRPEPQLADYPDLAAKAKPAVPTSAGASQPALMEPTRPTEAKLPAELSKAAPRYKTQQLNFESDIDRALYIVAKTDPLSKRDADYMAFLREQFPDRSDAELRRMGGYVRSAVGKKAGSTPSEQVAILHKDVSSHLAGLQKKAGTVTPPVKAAPTLATTTPARERKPLWADWGAPTTEEVYPKPPPAPPVPTQTPGGRIPGGPGNIRPSVSPDPYEQLKEARTPRRVTPGERISDAGSRLLREAYDKTFDVQAIEEATGIPAYKAAALVNGAVAYGENLARKHIVPVFDKVGKNIQALEDYMIGMRLQDILARNPHAQLPSDIDGWTGALEALEGVKKRLSPKDLKAVEDAATELWRLNDELVLRPRLEAGLISKKEYLATKAKHPHYISFYREDFTGLQKQLGQGAKIASLADDGIEAMDLAGSKRKLDRPLARFQAQVIHTQKLISQNKAAKTVADALLGMEGKPGGAKEAFRTGETWGKALRPGEKVEDSNIWGTISYLDKGEKVTVQVPRVYADIAKGLEAETADTLTSFFRAASTPLRAGAVTFNVAFTPKNVIRDAISAWYREGLVPWSKEYMDGWRAAWNMEKSDDFMEAAKDGVLMSGIVETMRNAEALATTNRLGAIKVNNAKDALLLFPRLVERFGVMSEQATRIATYKMLKAQGVGELERAVRARDVTVDFAKSGNFMKLMNQAVPFANAGVQGAANVLRTIKSNPKQAVMGAAPLATLTVMTYAWNQRYETAKDIPDYERENSWVFIVGEGTQNVDPKQPNKPGKKFPIYIKIPKGPLGAFITAPFETMMDIAWAKDNRSVLEHLMQGAGRMATSLSPIEPSALLTPPGNLGAALLTGVDPWRQEDIIPKGEQARFSDAPELQYGPETSKAAVLMEKAVSLGGRYHVSPRMIEWAIKNYAAGVGQQGLWLADIALGALGFDPAAFGEGQQRELSDWEKAGKLPVASGFIGTRATEQRNRGWDEFNKAVGEAQREFAKVSQLRSLNVMPGQVADTISIGKYKITLEPAERAELQRRSVEAMLERAEPILAKPEFSKLPVDLQKKLLGNAFDKGRERARLDYLDRLPKEVIKQRIRESYPQAILP